MPAPTVNLRSLPGEYVIARLAVGTDVSSALIALLRSKTLLSVTQTDQELSIVCEAGAAPDGAELDGPWRVLYAAGPIPFGLTGVVSSLVGPLAAIDCPVFVVSTFDGDVLMTPTGVHADAVAAMREAGHTVDTAAVIDRG